MEVSHVSQGNHESIATVDITTSHDEQPTEALALTLTAYAIHPNSPMRLVPATTSRDWIDATHNQFARRCLPLLIANQAGWFILNSHALRVTWDGSDALEGLTLEWLSGDPPYPAVSHFGHGILTWTLPYLFRTPPGYQLLARGPSNWPKDGIFALEGLVETDWSVATFTMNWMLMAVDHPVEFEAGEPICMIVPQRCDTLEAFQPELRDILSDPDHHRAFTNWSTSRSRHLVDLKVPNSQAQKQGWQKDYFRGRTPAGQRAPAHRTKLQLRSFQAAADSGSRHTDSSGSET
jgi:hypothetical protein